MVFDNNFTIVPSRPDNLDPPEWWNAVDLEDNIVRVPLDEDTSPLVDKDWFSPEELEERSRHSIQQAQLRQAFVSELIQNADTIPLFPPPSYFALSQPLNTQIVPASSNTFF